MKTIIVTGGCGFIGTNFVKYVLKQFPDCHVYNLDALTYAGNPGNHDDLKNHGQYHFVHGSINDPALLESLFSEKQIDAVFHFAAESHVDRSIHEPAAFMNTNILGTFQLLEASRQYLEVTKNSGFRFVHVSTDEVYGSLGFDDPAFEESFAYNPSSPYSASKASSDHLVRAYFKTYGMPAVITNCSNNYGPYQFPEKLIPLTIINILDKKPIPVYGRGENVRDWLYVQDHCEALIQVFLNGMAGESYNIGGGEEIQNIDVVTTICQIMDEKLNRPDSATGLIKFVADRKGHDLRYAINPQKTSTQIGWKAQHSFEQALARTIDWYLENMAWVRSILSKEYLNWIQTQYG